MGLVEELDGYVLDGPLVDVGKGVGAGARPRALQIQDILAAAVVVVVASRAQGGLAAPLLRLLLLAVASHPGD